MQKKMLKKYLINGKEWQFEEGKQPKGAKELKAKEPKAVDPPVEKKAAPKNKAAKPANKSTRKVEIDG